MSVYELLVKGFAYHVSCSIFTVFSYSSGVLSADTSTISKSAQRGMCVRSATRRGRAAGLQRVGVRVRRESSGEETRAPLPNAFVSNVELLQQF